MPSSSWACAARVYMPTTEYRRGHATRPIQLAMKIKAHKNELRVIIPYSQGNAWLSDWAKRSSDALITLSKAFTVSRDDIIEGLNEEDNEQIVFRIGSKHGNYWKVNSDVINTSFDLYLSVAEHWEQKHFVAEQAVRIFPYLNKVVQGSLYLGGDHPDSVPFVKYDSLIRKLPSRTELQKYIAARLANSLREHFDIIGDPEKAYENFLNKRLSAADSPTRKTVALAEKEKFEYLLTRLHEMMSQAVSYSEAKWQDEILAIITLLFPKYLFALKSIPIRDLDGRRRQIDIGLLDVDGNLDVVEIKKPFDLCVMSTGRYRNNYVPLRELSGAVMQVEKYILYLQRGGAEQDKRIQKKYKDLLPVDFKVKIVNPRGMVILGRSNTLSAEQNSDFEVVRRKYSRIADIITYDDLIRRIEILRDCIKKLNDE